MTGAELKQLRLERNLTQVQLEEATGVPQPNIARYERTGVIPKADIVEIFERFFKSEQKTPISRIEARPLRLVDPYGLEATGQKFYTLSDGSDVMQIPVVPVKAYGSYLRGHADPEFYDGFETLTIPVDKQHKGTYLAFEMDGESMVNIETKEMARKSLWPGQKIICRDLKREHWKYKLHIHSNEAWVIVHQTEGVVVKEITNHNIDTGEITLHSWNPDKEQYRDYIVNLNDVQQLFNVVDPFGKMKPY